MKKQLLIVGITVVLIAVGLSGCTEEENNKDSEEIDPSSSDNIIRIYNEIRDWQNIPVFIQDVAGDVRTSYAGEEVNEFDVKTIKIAMDNTYLYMLVEFVQDFNYYFDLNGEQSKTVGVIYLDTDNDENTGGEEFFSKVGGFESRIDIWSGVGIKGTGNYAGMGSSLSDISTLEDINFEEAELEYYMVYTPSKYDESTDSLNIDFNKDVRSTLQETLIAYTNNYLELTIPLIDVDIQFENNKTIRAVFSEKGSGSWGSGEDTFSDEVIAEIPLWT